MAGKNSRVNHTETALAAGATFTGEWESVVQYSSIRVSVITDQNGTLYIDTSPNQSASDETLSYSITAGAAADYSIDVSRRYFRLRFTNTAGSPQTYIRLNSLLSDGIATTSSTVAGTVAVSNFPGTQAISAAALPLPSGAATSAKQDTAQTSLSSIDSKLSSTLTNRPADTTASGSGTAVDAALTLAVAGMGTATITVTGTFVATLAFEGSGDGGTTWVAVAASNAIGSSFSTSTSTTGVFRLVCSSFTHIRGRISAYTSGTVSVNINASAGSELTTVAPTLINGNDGGTYRSAVVKAASTAPQATDPTLVVGLSPNGGHATAAKQDSIIAEIAGLKNTASTVNSSSTPLNAGATFTGTSEDVQYHGSVAVAVKTDQAGALYVEFSPDGTNWDSSLAFAVAASTNEVHRLTVTRRYYRVRFTNTSASNQTYFRLQSLYGEQPALSSPLNSVIQTDADAIVTRTVDPDVAIASGLFQNYSVVTKFGKNSDVDTGAVPEDVWDGGGTYTGFPTGAPENLVVVSTSASDTGTLTFTYLATATSTAYAQASVTLNGTTPVNTGVSVYRVHTARYSSGAATTFNVGAISGYHATTTANIFFVMQAGRSQSNTTAYTVPTGATAYIKRVFCRVIGATTGQIDGSLWIRMPSQGPRLRRPFSASSSDGFEERPYGGLEVSAGCDIIMRVTYASSNNLEVAGGYDLVLINDD